MSQTYQWVCSCGRSFTEIGDRTGWHAAMLHHREHKSSEDGEGILGLASVNNPGDMLIKGLSLRNAQVKGYVERKNPEKEQAKSEEDKEQTKLKAAEKKLQKAFDTVAGISRATMRYQNIELDPAIDICFMIARTRYPGEYDDKDGMARFLRECILLFFQEHAAELGFDALLSRALEVMYTGIEPEPEQDLAMEG